MSIDKYSDDGSDTVPEPGTDFEADRKRIGAIMQQAIRNAHADEDIDYTEFDKAAMEMAQDVAVLFKEQDVDPEMAIHAAWYFLLGYAAE